MFLMPLAAFILLSILFRKPGRMWSEALLIAFVVLSFLVVLMTELLGLFDAIRPCLVGLVWGIFLIIIICVAGSNRRKISLSFEWSNLLPAFVLSCFVVLAVPILWRVDNFDSMVYHMPRVERWLQEGSVAHYPCSIMRQLYQPPMMEYWLLQLRVLGATEQVYGVFPGLMFLLSGLSAASLVANLSKEKSAPWVTFVFVISMPGALLLSSAPKNDILLGVYLLLSLYFLFVFRASASPVFLYLTTLCTALAILTKGTAWVFVPLIALLLSYYSWRYRSRGGRVWAHYFCAAFLCLLMLLPHHLRNWRTFGSPLSPRPIHGEIAYSNASLGPRVVLSNIARNIGIGLKSPCSTSNFFIQRGVEHLHTFLRQDINAPETTWPGTSFSVLEPYRYHEDEASNFPQGLLVLVCLFLSIFTWRRISRPHLLLAAVGGVSFVLFSVLLKWQPWHTRLHIPFLFIGVVLAVSHMSVFRLGRILLFAGLAFSIPFGLYATWSSELRPLSAVSSGEIYRQSAYPDNVKASLDALSVVRRLNPDTLALVFGQNTWEYPIWSWMYAHGVKWRLSHADSYVISRNLPASLDSRAVYLVERTAASRWPALREGGYRLMYANSFYDVYISPEYQQPSGTPILVQPLSSFSDGWFSEETANGDRWRWAGARSKLSFTTVERGGFLSLSFQLASSEGARAITIRSSSGAVIQSCTLDSAGRRNCHVSIPVSSDGRVDLEFLADGRPCGTDPRGLFFALFNLNVIWIGAESN